jgi:hypothetical protein
MPEKAPHSGSFQAAFIAGSLSQSVATTPGASYTIDFFLAEHNSTPSNSFSVSCGGSTIFSLTNQNSFGYTEYTFTETASTASTQLAFTTLITDGGISSTTSASIPLEWAFPMLAQHYRCSAALCSAWLPFGANWLRVLNNGQFN